ncbi:MAG: PilZ domain-containing protein [Burkholderiales bacterium]|nr:PilZ domain-containing protein [Burkholderiales bacterium]
MDMQVTERRKNPRSPLHSRGFAMMDGIRVNLKTHDVSLGGSLVELEDPPELEEGSTIDVRLEIGFDVKARVCRVSKTANGNLMIGLIFDKLDFSANSAYQLH